jgi:mono/diheme cytochrome c family protein
LVLAAAACGCGAPPDAVFAPNSEKSGPLIEPARVLVEQVLAEHFGTPQKLVAWQKLPIDYGRGDPASENPTRHSDGWRLAEGRKLYMTHCLHCHGVSGDGAGPTARFLNPRPRDYRQGIFKFKSTQLAMRPSRDDLTRVLEQGIPGTYMPSFVLLGSEQLGLIVDYVRWLSMRGELEIRLADAMVGAGASEAEVNQSVADSEGKLKLEDARAAALKTATDELAEQLAEASTIIVEAWNEAELPESQITPRKKRTPPTAESLERGRKLFMSQVPGKQTQCVDCHGPTGKGDGPNTEKFWPDKRTRPERNFADIGLHDAWGYPQDPRNLTRGVYRGGRRPVDIYRKIYAGINGTQMPGFATVLQTDEEIWDLVNYVLSIPFEGRSSPFPGDPAAPGGEAHPVTTTSR